MNDFDPNTPVPKRVSLATVISTAIVISGITFITGSLVFFYGPPRNVDKEYINQVVASQADLFDTQFRNEINLTLTGIMDSVNNRAVEGEALRVLADDVTTLVTERKELFAATSTNMTSILELGRQLRQVQAEWRRLQELGGIEASPELQQTLATIIARVNVYYLAMAEQDRKLAEFRIVLEELNRKVNGSGGIKPD